MNALVWLATLGLAAAPRQVATFDAGPRGSAPPGWTLIETHRKPEARWEIRQDQTAPTPPYVLAPVPASDDANLFPIAVLETMTMRDGDVSVRLRPVSGRSGQAAGLVWRYRDPRNFYLARLNVLENNIGVYRVVDGQYYALTPRGSPPGTRGVHRIIQRSSWSIFKVAVRGRRISVYINHRRIMETDDSSIDAPGKVGLWTRGDTVVYFDDFRATAR
jgi:hypothetical protein